MGFTQLEDTVTFLSQALVPAICVWMTPLVCPSLCLMAILTGALASATGSLGTKKVGA